MKRWLLPALAVSALAPCGTAAAASWRLEPIGASEGVAGLHDLD